MACFFWIDEIEFVVGALQLRKTCVHVGYGEAAEKANNGTHSFTYLVSQIPIRSWPPLSENDGAVI